MIKNEAKEQKGGFFRRLSGILGAVLLGNLLTNKGTIRAREGVIATSQGQGTLELVRIFNTTSSFNKFWHKKVLSK